MSSVRPPVEFVRRVWPVGALPHYPRDQRTIAYHEAGHAVFCRLLNIPMARIEAEQTGGGRVSFAGKYEDKDDLDPLPRETLETAAVELACMYVAGVMAETVLHRVNVSGMLLLDTPDWRNAERVLLMAFNSTAPLGYCQRLARAVLREQWEQVEAIAEALLVKGSLSGDEARAVADRG